MCRISFLFIVHPSITCQVFKQALCQFFCTALLLWRSFLKISHNHPYMCLQCPLSYYILRLRSAQASCFQFFLTVLHTDYMLVKCPLWSDFRIIEMNIKVVLLRWRSIDSCPLTDRITLNANSSREYVVRCQGESGYDWGPILVTAQVISLSGVHHKHRGFFASRTKNLWIPLNV